MRNYRFFVSPDQIHANRRLALSGDQARQIYNVLRMREADQLVVLDNRGWQYDVRLDKVTSNLVIGDILSRDVAAGEPQVELTLYQALLKKDNFEWVLQKGTELGVTHFVPLITQRCVVRQETVKPPKFQRWQRIIREAAEQSGRGRLPSLSTPIKLPEALEKCERFDKAFIPWEGETEKGMLEVLRAGVGEQPSRVAIFIGPEGGFEEAEIAEAEGAGLQPVTLGPRILRAETAAIVAATLALSALGELE
jgi:16S rRNA (uracil1498-N3)-methyltransferase